MVFENLYLFAKIILSLNLLQTVAAQTLQSIVDDDMDDFQTVCQRISLSLAFFSKLIRPILKELTILVIGT